VRYHSTAREKRGVASDDERDWKAIKKPAGLEVPPGLGEP